MERIETRRLKRGGVDSAAAAALGYDEIRALQILYAFAEALFINLIFGKNLKR